MFTGFSPKPDRLAVVLAALEEVLSGLDTRIEPPEDNTIFPEMPAPTSGVPRPGFIALFRYAQGTPRSREESLKEVASMPDFMQSVVELRLKIGSYLENASKELWNVIEPEWSNGIIPVPSELKRAEFISPRDKGLYLGTDVYRARATPGAFSAANLPNVDNEIQLLQVLLKMSAGVTLHDWREKNEGTSQFLDATQSLAKRGFGPPTDLLGRGFSTAIAVYFATARILLHGLKARARISGAITREALDRTFEAHGDFVMQLASTTLGFITVLSAATLLKPKGEDSLALHETLNVSKVSLALLSVLGSETIGYYAERNWTTHMAPTRDGAAVLVVDVIPKSFSIEQIRDLRDQFGVRFGCVANNINESLINVFNHLFKNAIAVPHLEKAGVLRG